MTKRPLGKIALALSGGGYRAAAFHLGTLRALRALDLLGDVRTLSTASGGSIVAAAWVTAIVDGADERERFEIFEQRLTTILATNVVAQALDLLRKGTHPSLIRCAADVYDGMFGKRRLGKLADEPALAEHLDHVIVNATHFSVGHGFRFTFPARNRGVFGNRTLQMPDDAWRDIRLADAVAASSCFPGGFEPIVFPHDFHWSGAMPAASAVGIEDEPETRMPLMDGGIYDNQAIDSVLLVDNAADKTVDPEDDLGLLFCSDVDQKQMPYYTAPARESGGIGAMPTGLAALIVALVASALLWWASSTSGWPAVGLASLGALLGFPALALFAFLAIAGRFMPFRYEPLFELGLGIPLRNLAALVVDRLHSVLELTTSVFMYRVRSLEYTTAFARMPERVVASRIYAAVMSRDVHASPEVIRRAKRARAMKTTLWMSEDERHDVEATGYASAVGALLRYLRKWRDTPGGPAAFRKDLPYPADLAARVEAAWKRINDTRSAHGPDEGRRS